MLVVLIVNWSTASLIEWLQLQLWQGIRVRYPNRVNWAFFEYENKLTSYYKGIIKQMVINDCTLYSSITCHNVHLRLPLWK
ncbi:hypothetical protein SFRURICE_012044 [Spodoptera frugiperda]|nr:hypothetical protein SFRURICE_012044 [Spodoptera frugiperda]